MITEKKGTDPRAVVDFYKYWEDEAILAHMDTKRHNFSIVLHNELKDLNLGNLVRSANTFMADSIILLYRRQYDRRSAISSYKYMHFKYAENLNDLCKVFKSIEIEKGMPVHVVGVDIIAGAKSLYKYKWPTDKHICMIFGHEGSGIDKNVLGLCDDIVYCPQYGSTRSLNVAVAGGIFMSDYCAKTISQ